MFRSRIFITRKLLVFNIFINKNIDSKLIEEFIIEMTLIKKNSVNMQGCIQKSYQDPFRYHFIFI